MEKFDREIIPTIYKNIYISFTWGEGWGCGGGDVSERFSRYVFSLFSTPVTFLTIKTSFRGFKRKLTGIFFRISCVCTKTKGHVWEN